MFLNLLSLEVTGILVNKTKRDRWPLKPGRLLRGNDKGTSMYYVSKKGGGRGSAKCLLLLTWGEGGLRDHAYVMIFWNFFLH